MKELTGKESYRELIDSFGVTVLVVDEDCDYQGDSRYLLKKGRQFGILEFGWGSCSGCDALEACSGNVAGMTKLRDELWNKIHWERGPRALLNYIEKKDWSLEYGNWGEFIDEATGKLSEILDN